MKNSDTSEKNKGFLKVYEKGLPTVNTQYTVFHQKSASIYFEDSSPSREEWKEKRREGGFETSPFRDSFLLFSSPC
jgi:hypothetical protein